MFTVTLERVQTSVTFNINTNLVINNAIAVYNGVCPLYIGMGVPFWMCRSYIFSHPAEGHNFFISQGGHHLNLGIKGSKVSRDIH